MLKKVESILATECKEFPTEQELQNRLEVLGIESFDFKKDSSKDPKEIESFKTDMA